MRLWKIKYRVDDPSLDPGMSIGGGDDYNTYGYAEWDRLSRSWIMHSGGTDGSTYEPYSSQINLETFTPPLVEEYLKKELDRMGIKVNLEMFKPLCKHNLETILERLSKKVDIFYRFELNDGRIALLKA